MFKSGTIYPAQTRLQWKTPSHSKEEKAQASRSRVQRSKDSQKESSRNNDNENSRTHPWQRRIQLKIMDELQLNQFYFREPAAASHEEEVQFLSISEYVVIKYTKVPNGLSYQCMILIQGRGRWEIFGGINPFELIDAWINTSESIAINQFHSRHDPDEKRTWNCLVQACGNSSSLV
jgi:hypothetical protein